MQDLSCHCTLRELVESVVISTRWSSGWSRDQSQPREIQRPEWAEGKSHREAVQSRAYSSGG
jgi:hypothetical protein